MTAYGKISWAALATAVSLSLSACVGVPGPASTMMPAGDCFSSTQWQGWSSPTDDVLYLRVRPHDVYRVDLLPGTGSLDRGGQFIISEVRGSNRICSANDLELSIASTTGFRSPLFPRAIRKLTPAEVAALPPKDRP